MSLRGGHGRATFHNAPAPQQGARAGGRAASTAQATADAARWKQMQQQYDERQEEEEALRRQLEQQNQMFWEAARRKDDDILAWQRECAAISEELQGLQAVQAEAAERSLAKEAKAQEAEQSLVKTREDLRISRREATERVRRHVEDMEALSDTLCAAQSRFQEAENALQAARREAAVATAELAEVPKDPLDKLHAAMQEEQALLSRLAAERCRADALAEENTTSNIAAIRQAEAFESAARESATQLALEEAAAEKHKAEAAEAHAATKSNELAEKSEAATALLFQSHAEAADVKEMEMEQALRRAQGEVQGARSEVSNEKEALEAERRKTADALDEARAARGRADRFMARLHEEKEEFRQEQIRREAGETLAAGSALMLEEAQRRADDAEDRRVKAERLFFAEQLSAKRDEVAAVEAEAAQARRALGAEVLAEAAFKRSMAEAEKSQEVLRRERARLEAELGECKEELCCTRNEAAASLVGAGKLEEALAEEFDAARAKQAAFLLAEGEAAIRSAEALAAATSATKAAEESEESLAAELTEESLMQASLKKQAENAKAQTVRLQEAAKLQAEVDEERAQELAATRADATRHARFNTELRAEMADTKRELSKCRHAARSLTQVSNELEATLVKLNKAQRELEAARQRQVGLERQVREASKLQATSYDTRGDAYPLRVPFLSQIGTQGTQPTEPGSASTDGWHLLGEQSHARPVHGGAPETLGHTVHADVTSQHTIPSPYSDRQGQLEATATNSAADTSSPAPGLGRSQSLGAITREDSGFSSSQTDWDGSGAGRPPLPLGAPLGMVQRPPPAPGSSRQTWASSNTRRGSGSSSEDVVGRQVPSPGARKGSRSPLNRSSETLGLPSDCASGIDKVVR
eukprot:TRINITY_DN75984_c0_g1_i1.p1 TRINITY_DN75984_c0_g1~~TRINITY_DN75984_c0_g1_i1.p1  ORF type:complete len:876 (+),score=244.97 TRINITY_DN75984_c0_g1_i1:98-2725(+)